MKSIDDVKQKYRNAACLQREYTLNGDHKNANMQYSILKRLFDKFKKHEVLQLQVLPDLLHDESYYVRSWAATHSLGLNLYQEEAINILIMLSERDDIGILRYNAEMTLKTWREQGYLDF